MRVVLVSGGVISGVGKGTKLLPPQILQASLLQGEMIICNPGSFQRQDVRFPATERLANLWTRQASLVLLCPSSGSSRTSIDALFQQAAQVYYSRPLVSGSQQCRTMRLVTPFETSWLTEEANAMVTSIRTLARCRLWSRAADGPLDIRR
jgi:hypothetical protein